MPVLLLDLIYVAMGVAAFASPRFTSARATICEGLSMTFDMVLGAIVTIASVYLVAALICPERF